MSTDMQAGHDLRRGLNEVQPGTKSAKSKVLREARRRVDEELAPPAAELLPPERFSDEYWPPDPEVKGRRGPQSSTVTARLARSCCGWRRVPDAGEFYEAMRQSNPTARQLGIAGVLIDEGSTDELQRAYFEGAFTWRQLVRMMIRRGGTHDAIAWYVNQWTAENTRRVAELLDTS